MEVAIWSLLVIIVLNVMVLGLSSQTSFFASTDIKITDIVRHFSQRGWLIETSRAMLSILGRKSPLHLRIFYDHTHEDMAMGLISGSVPPTGVMTFKYGDSLTSFEPLLTPADGTVILLLLCPPRLISHIFETIQNKRWSSHFVLWLTMLEDERDKDQVILGTEGNIDEGTQVIIVLRESAANSQIFSSRLGPEGGVRLTDLGIWNVVSDQSKRLLPDLLLSPDNVWPYCDLKGRQLLVGANDNLPLLKKSRMSQDGGGLLPASGIDNSVIQTLAHILNFTYNLVDPQDGKWGGPLPNGTVTGIIGSVVRKEVHFGVSGVSIIRQRERVVDMTHPYYQDYLCLVSRAPQQKNRAFAVFSPFTTQVWICLVIATLAIGPLLTIQSRVSVIYLKEDKHKTNKTNTSSSKILHTYSFNMFRSLVTQGNQIVTKSWSLRMVFFFWYLFCLMISALYSGTLTAVLAIPSYEKPIDSLLDLPRAVGEGFIVGTVKETVIEYLLRGAEQGIYKQTWDFFNHEDLSESLVENPVIGFNKILKSKFLFIAPLAVSGVAVTTIGRSKYHLGRQPFYPINYGFAFHTGSPLKAKFDKVFLRLVEGGLVSKWGDDEILKVMDKFSLVEGRSLTPPAISIIHLQAAFFVFLLGILVSTTALILENICEY